MNSRISSIENKTIIVAPLDWGLGHATRCIPIIRALMAQANRVIIATSGRSLELLQKEFTTLEFEQLPEYGITYGKSAVGTFFKLLLQIPKSLFAKNEECKIASQLVTKYSADIIISDNRFGMHSSLCKSIFITHQIRVRLPWYVRFLEYPFFLINKRMITKFNECWIPDYEGENNISGILSHSWSIPNAVFIGPLTAREFDMDNPKAFDVVAILSGPEPQRSMFETELRNVLPDLPYTSCIIRGVLAKKNQSTKVGNCIIQTFADNSEINQYLSGASLIISRAGYSSIMDYEKLKVRAILVPTPGQSEQEYLSDYLKSKSNYFSVSQNQIKTKLAATIASILKK